MLCYDAMIVDKASLDVRYILHSSWVKTVHARTDDTMWNYRAIRYFVLFNQDPRMRECGTDRWPCVRCPAKWWWTVSRNGMFQSLNSRVFFFFSYQPQEMEGVLIFHPWPVLLSLLLWLLLFLLLLWLLLLLLLLLLLVVWLLLLLLSFSPGKTRTRCGGSIADASIFPRCWFVFSGYSPLPGGVGRRRLSSPGDGCIRRLTRFPTWTQTLCPGQKTTCYLRAARNNVAVFCHGRKTSYDTMLPHKD